MEQPITHKAEILSINGHEVTLRMLDSTGAACGGCRLADLCGKADTGGRVTVTVDTLRGLAEGMTVEASVSDRSQGLAIVWTLLMPLIIFTGLLMPLTITSLPRWAVIATAIGGVGIYDLLLWRFGPKLSRSIKWTLNTIL